MINRVPLRVLLFSIMLFIAFPNRAFSTQASDVESDSTDQISIHFVEDFDAAGIGDWFADNGIWEAGIPTAGPDTAVTGTQVIGTILDGDYPPIAHSRLISPRITLPSSQELDGARLRLKFYHWYSLSSGDSGQVQTSTDGVNWTTIPGTEAVAGISTGWETYIVADLSDFEGQTLFLGFLFDATDASTSTGWYIDNIQFYFESTEPGISQENFEAPILDWEIENGVWQFGAPSRGPAGAFSGSWVAGTTLDGAYPDSDLQPRLISPPIVIPDLSESQSLGLRFWHWFNLTDGDAGRLQLSVDEGEWLDLPGVFTGQSSVWTKYLVPDLLAFTPPDASVRISFLLTTENNGTNGDGWYVDEFETFIVEPPPFIGTAVDSSRNALIQLGPEDLNQPGQEWFSDNGVWEVGLPASGPGNAYTGSLAAGTVLAGNYPNGTRSRFVSPPFTVNLDSPILRFWHWFDFSDGDQGVVQIKREGDDWVDISTPFTGTSGVWTQYIVPSLEGYRDDVVHIGFLVTSQESGPTKSGWYLDDIRVNERGVANETGFDVPDEPMLRSNYPNPFSLQTTISYYLSTPGPAVLTIYDVLGREIETLVDEMLPAGNHEAAWRPESATSGVYFFRLQTNGVTQTQRMILTR